MQKTHWWFSLGPLKHWFMGCFKPWNSQTKANQQKIINSDIINVQSGGSLKISDSNLHGGPQIKRLCAMPQASCLLRNPAPPFWCYRILVWTWFFIYNEYLVVQVFLRRSTLEAVTYAAGLWLVTNTTQPSNGHRISKKLALNKRINTRKDANIHKSLCCHCDLVPWAIYPALDNPIFYKGNPQC